MSDFETKTDGVPFPGGDASATSLSFRGGELRVANWPESLVVPFGFRREGRELRGPARLRVRVLELLRRVGGRFVDHVRAERFRAVPLPDGRPGASLVASLLRGFEDAAYRGTVVGLAMDDRLAAVHALLAAHRCRIQLVVLDTGAQHAWQAACVERAIDGFVDVHTVAHAAQSVAWLGGRYDALVVDDCELMPVHQLEPVVDGAVAIARIGFVGRPERTVLERLSAGLGPLIAALEARASPPYCELRLGMPRDCCADYERAWHRFFAAFDHFAAMRPGVGFGSFVQQARRDPQQRPALLAWHEAVRIASWHANKAAAVATLLERHRGQRVLIFTPDRRVAYALAREHLIGAITAELSLAERRELLAAFANGSVRVLAGPRLLDVGVAEGAADIGILVGGGYGRSQREARRRRVREDGLLYELVSRDSLEVGRSRRWRGAAEVSAVVEG